MVVCVRHPIWCVYRVHMSSIFTKNCLVIHPLVLLLGFPSSQQVFVESTMMLVEENTYMAVSIFEAKCKSEHKFKLMFRNLAQHVFNICSKNIVRQIH